MADPSSGPVLLVGFQRGVRRALRSSGRRALALVDRGAAPTDEVAGWRRVALQGALEPVVAAARELLEGETPAAVVALAERTVLVAAELREALGVPGNDAAVALCCADKVEMKRAMQAAGVPVAPWRAVHRETSARELMDALGLPLVLKPRRDSGGRGQERLDDERALARALASLHERGELERGYGWLAEGWIEGVEMSVESFVGAGAVRFLNPTEYFVPRHANVLPAPLEDGFPPALRAFVERALRAAGVERGVTHLELFRTASGPVFGELAIRPPGGRLMTLLERAWGFDPWQAMLELELGGTFVFPDAPRCTAGVWVLHPGPGTVTAIHGLEETRALPHVRRVALKVAPGRQVPERTGTGQDVGALYVEGPDRNTVAAALERARASLRIEVR